MVEKTQEEQELKWSFANYFSLRKPAKILDVRGRKDKQEYYNILIATTYLEWQLSREEYVKEYTQAPDVGLGEGLGLLHDLRGGVVEVVGSLDLGTGLGHGLGGLEVGQLDLEGLAQGPSGAHQHVGGLQVEVSASTPGDVVQSVKNLESRIDILHFTLCPVSKMHNQLQNRDCVHM